MTLRGVLLDMNGVFRHFDHSGQARAEALASLPPGTIARYAYDHPDYELAKVGVLTHQEWTVGVEARLVATYGPAAAVAIEPWLDDRGTVERRMLDIARQLRTSLTVGVLSNFTDELHADIVRHDMTDAFDHVFTSHDLWVQKPSPLAYLRAAERMGIEPGELLYLDDQRAFVQGARKAGLRAELFTGVNDFVLLLHANGIAVS
ncbi:HAD-IA family hydrolase (plasmid) [Embleya sp. NBC_00888]|uniref:HAD-IA family hydrolase n=1 Tax=Embleya sp. NBC_00888 TaxID=2975960 RepID=UPI002F916961|nr:HAD-IA family hydrolase [Embleya sp. NBC_00888]